MNNDVILHAELWPPRFLHDEEALRRADGIDALTLLVERHTLAEVRRWLDRIALLKGEPVGSRQS